MDEKLLTYLAGGIMSRGENLARQEEYDKIMAENLPLEIYSPVMNKSINDKSNMTEEENNHLAEKIVAADVDRLWNSDVVVACPEQSAIGTMCEMAILYAWKYMYERLSYISVQVYNDAISKGMSEEDAGTISNNAVFRELLHVGGEKAIFAHYDDIRTNHLNEKDWRRSFSINQFLYGIILAATSDSELHNNFDEILPKLHELYDKKPEDVTNEPTV